MQEMLGAVSLERPLCIACFCFGLGTFQQCEVGKFIDCGVFLCRRHQLRGTNNSGGSTYYIGGNRYRARFPVPPRNLEEDVSKMSEIGNED